LLKQLLDVTPRGEPLFPAGVREEIFRPENLFWNPEGKAIDESWHPFWEETLLLGDSLLRAGLAWNSGWSKESFWQRLVALRDGIKERLFMDQTRTQELGQSDEGRVVYTILKDILEKWEKALRADDTGLLETVVLPSKGPRDERGIPDTKDEAAVKETVVASPEGISDETVVATGEPEQGDLEETVVISPASKEEKGPISSHERDEEPLPETVILSRKEPSRGGQGFPPEEKKAAPREKATSGPEPTEEEIGRTRRKKEADFLTETVFISPQERGKLDKDKKK